MQKQCKECILGLQCVLLKYYYYGSSFDLYKIKAVALWLKVSLRLTLEVVLNLTAINSISNSHPILSGVELSNLAQRYILNVLTYIRYYDLTILPNIDLLNEIT